MKNYEDIKTDHTSNCSKYNAPSNSVALCNCGLIEYPAEGIRDHLNSIGPFIHEGEVDSVVSGFQAGYNFKSIGSDIQYLLDEFKSIESEYFDKDGKAYPIKSGTRNSDENLELMRHLIYKLEEIINQKDHNDWAF